MLKQLNKTNLRLLLAKYLSCSFRFVFLLVALTGVFLYTRGNAPTHVSAATSSNLNFQARLLTASGSIVPDGTYNVEFKLYNVSSGGSALWTETYYDTNGVTAGNDFRVTVKSGYLSVQLGSLSTFPAINWDQDLWLTMNIGGVTQTATPTYDGEMAPRLKLTAVPYAFAAGQVAKYNGTQTGTLSFGTVANSPDIKLPDITGTNNVLLQSGTTLFTQGSIPFATSAGLLTQDNANYFFDDTNNTLGVGTTRTGAIDGIGNSRVVIQGSGSTSATSSLNVRNSSGSGSLFLVRDDGNVGIGATAPGAKLEVDAAASGIGVILKANVTTPGDLLQLQDSIGNVNAKFSGTGNTLTLGRISASGTVTAGNLLFADGTNDGFAATVGTQTLTADRKFLFPDSGLATTASPGTICVFNGASSNCPAATGSAAYIQNTTGSGTPQSAANFNIQATNSTTNGTIGGIIRGAAGGQTVDLFQLQATGGSVLSKFDASGNLSVGTATSPTGGVATFNGNVGIGTASIGANNILDVAAGNTKSVNITSDLTGGARSAYAVNITQANDATNNNSVGLLSLTNSDAASTASLVNLNQVNNGTNINIATTIGNGGIGINFASGIGNGMTGGTGIKLNNISNNGIGVDFLMGSNATGINGTFTGNSGLAGNFIRLQENTVATGTGTNTANLLNLTRSQTANATFTLTENGDLVNLASNCGGAGTCVDSSHLIKLNQQYASASGSVLDISNSGTGAAILLNSGASIASAAATNLSLISGTTGTLNLDTGTTGAITLGTNANAKSVTIGSVTGASVLNLQSGTGTATGDINIGDTAIAGKIIDIGSVTNAATSTVRIATAAAVQTVTVGSIDTTSTLTLQGGTGAGAVSIQSGTSGTISIGSSGVANTLQLGNTTGAVAQTINIGNNATASSSTTLMVGSLIGTSPMTLQAGTSGILAKPASGTTAFQVQNTSGNSVLNIDTTTTNLISNPSFEINTTGWVARAGTTLTRITTQQYSGTASLQMAFAANNQGANYNVPLSSSTQYTLSLYAKTISGGSALFLYRSENGSSEISTGCIGSFFPPSNGWNRLTCTFTTGTTSGTTYISALTGSGPGTILIDGVQLEASSSVSPYREGSISLNGTITSPATFKNISDSNSAFQIQNASGTSLFDIDTLNSGVNIGGALTTGTVTVGGTAQTGTITLGRSTATNSINIGNGTVAAGNTQTINIGTNSTGTGKDAITIGSTNDASSLTLQAGTGSVLIKSSVGNLLQADTGNQVINVYGNVLPSVTAGAATTSSGTNSIAAVDANFGSGNGASPQSSIAVGSDGLPVTSYYANKDSSLRLAKCANTSCTSTTTRIVDGAPGSASVNVGQYSSVKMVSGLLPGISYYDATGGNLKYVLCGDVRCASNSITTLDSTGDVGQYTSMAIGSDGFPVISYYDVTNTALKVVKCGNAACSASNTVTVLDGVAGCTTGCSTTADAGKGSSIAVPADGKPVITYYDAVGGNLRLLKCGNTTCSSGNTYTNVEATSVITTSVAIGSDGFPIMVVYDGGSTHIVKCGNASCSSGNTITTLDSFSTDFSTYDQGPYGGSIAVPADGKPVVAYSYIYHDYSPGPTQAYLKVIKCSNASCTASTLTNPDGVSSLNPTPANVGADASVAINTDGFPVISYLSSLGTIQAGSLGILKCGTNDCSGSIASSNSNNTGISLGSSEYSFGSGYIDSIRTTTSNFEIMTNDTQRLLIDTSGRVGIGTATPANRLDVAGSTRLTASTTSVITGSIDPTASASVTGVGTLFNTELVVGDRIIVSGETRTVTAIASDTALTVDTAFSNNANDTSVDRLPAALTVRDSSNALKFIISDVGNVGIGTTTPTAALHVLGTNGVNGGVGTAGTTGLTAVGGNGGTSSTASTAGGAAGGLSLTGGNGGNASGTTSAGGAGGAISLTAGNGGNSTGVAGTNGASITLQGGAGGTGTSTGAYGALNLNTTGGSVNIGNTNGATGLIERVGTGNYSLDGVGASTYTLGASTTTGTFTVGGTAQTGTLTVGQSTASNTINIGSAAGNTFTQTINIGNSVTAGSTTNLVLGSTIAGTTTLQSAGGVKLTTLGAADTDSYTVCRDASTTQLTACDANSTGRPFLQNGNSFGATADLGTNDANNLQFHTGGAASTTTIRLTLDQSNNAYFGNGATAATPNAFTIQGTGSATAGTAGAALTVKAGAGTNLTTGSAGGALNLQGGVGGTPASTGNATAGGAINITGGAAGGLGAATALGGAVSIQGGTSFGTTTGSSVSITGGAGIGTNQNGGTVTLQGGAPTGTGASGSVIVKSNINNSTTAFQVQNKDGNSPLLIDTTNSNSTLGLTNPSFEAGTTGWNARTGCTLSQDVTTRVFGLASGKCVNTATANAGANYPLTLVNGTQYTFSFYAKASANPASVLNFGYAYNGSNEATYVSIGQFLGTAWNRYSYTFTPSGITGTPYFFIAQSDALARNINIDGVQIEASSAANHYADGYAQLPVLRTPLQIEPTDGDGTALRISQLNSSTTPLLVANTTSFSVGIGSAGQTNNLLQIGSTNQGTADYLARVYIGGINTTNKNLVIQAATGQSGNLFEAQNSSGGALIAIDVNGNLTTGTNTDLNVIANGTGVINLNDSVKVATLGASTANSTSLCRDSSTTLLTACDANTTGRPFLQGGNTIGATADLGTNDANNLQFHTGGAASTTTIRLTLDQSNNAYFGNGVTAATPNAFTIQGTGSATAGTAGAALTVAGGAGTATGTGSAGGALNLQGGNAGAGSTAQAGGAVSIIGGAAAGTGNANGANVTLQGGAGVGTGVQGLVTLASTSYTASTTEASAVSFTIAQSKVDNNSTIPINATAASLTVTLPAPTQNVVGRLLYITAVSGSNTFTIAPSGGTSFTMAANSTATFIWNGTAWTNAGVDGGSASYIQNQSAADQTANFRVSGTGQINTSLTTPLVKSLDSTGSGNGANLTIQSGAAISGNNNVGGNLILKTGDAVAGNTRGSGTITIDSGSAQGGAATGTISIGTTNASALTISKVGVLTTIQGNLTLGASAGSGTLLTNNGATVNATLALGNFATGGAIGTAAATVDLYTAISIAQTTAAQTLTIPAPTANTTYGRLVYISNVGTTGFTLLGVTLNGGSSATLVWSNTNGGASWTFAGADGSAIVNQNSADQTANFRISGTGQINTKLLTPLIDTVSGNLEVRTGNVSRLTIDTSNVAYFGNGVTNASAGNFTLQATGGSGLNKVGSTLSIAGGQGTGTNNGGDIIFQYSPAGVSSSTLNPLATACSISGTNGSLSCPGAGANTERFGAGSTAASNDSVAIGTGATVTNVRATAVGRSASAGQDSVALGYNASNSNTSQIAIGSGASTGNGGSGSIAIGAGATTGTNSNSIALGKAAVVTADNQLVIGASTAGSTGAAITNVYVGNGVTNTTPVGFTLQATGSGTAGTNGVTTTIKGGGGATVTTGSAGGALSLQGGAAGGSGVNNGGNVTIDGGAKTSTGSVGNVILQGSNSGNVGIGASSPGKLLSVGGSTGNLTVDSAGSLTLGASAGSGTLLTNNGATLNSTLALTNFATGGSIGSAATTVDIYSSISVLQTTTLQTLTIPAPTTNPTTVFGRILYLSNVGTASFTLGSTTVNPGTTATLIWSNTDGAATGGESWQFAGADGNGILNQNTTTQTANFRISGVGQASGFDINSSGTLTIATGTTAGQVASAVTIGNNTNNTAVTVNTGGSGLAVNANTLTANNSFGLQNTTTITGTAAAQTYYGEKLSVTNSQTTNANTVYGQYISFTGAGSLANTLTGLYVDATTANTSDTTYAAVLLGGNVGIGTATPQRKLAVMTADGGGILIHTDNSSIGTNARLEFGYGTNGLNQNARLRTDTIAGGGSDLILEAASAVNTFNANQLVLDSGGNVGIGTAAPTAQLHVIGLNQSTAATAAAQTLQVTGGTGGATNAGSQTGGTGSAIILTGGTGGTGQASSTAGVGGSVSLNGGAAGAINGGTGNNGGAINLQGGAPTGAGAYGNIVLNASGGKVGIGTANPGAALDIQATLGPTLQLGPSTSVTTGKIGSMVFRNGNDLLAAKIESYNPSGAYTDQEDLRFFTTYQTTGERLRITPLGDVGINTTTPGTKLEVNGSVRLTAKLTNIINGSIDPTASASVTGVGTVFTQDLIIGDRIVVSGETRTVTAIASDTALTVDSAFSNNANDTSVDRLPAALIVQDSSNTVKLVVNDSGSVGIGITGPSAVLHVSSASSGTDLFKVTDTTATAQDVLKIADGGATTFRNQTDSAAAFTIQTGATGDTVFTADTTVATGGATGNRVKIGNNTGTDTNTTLFTVDQASTAPTTIGANNSAYYGSSYYDTTKNSMQCYEASNYTQSGNVTAWGDCGSTTLQAAYSNGLGSTTPEVLLDTTRNGIDIQDANSTIGTTLLAVRASATATTLGTGLFTVENTGNTTSRVTADSAASFQIQNASGATLLSLDSTNTSGSLNLAANGGAENGASPPTSWVAQGAATVTKDTTTGEFASGTASAKAATTGANQGAKNNLGSALAISTTYNVSFSIKAGTSAPTNANLSVIYLRDGSTTDATCSSFTASYNPIINTSTFIKYTCTFATSASAGNSSAALAIQQLDGSIRSLFIDNLSIVAQNATGTQNTGSLHVGGANSQGLTLLTLDSYAGTPFTGTNTALVGSMYFDTTSGKIQCYDGSVWGACGAAPNSIVTLTPEYNNAVLNGTGIGTLTSDLCSNSGGLSVNTGLCASTDGVRNFYKWTSVQTTQQVYSLYVNYKLPSTFKNFTSGSTTLTARTDNTTNGIVTYEIYKSVIGTGVSSCSAAKDVTTSGGANVWSTGSATTDPSTCGFAGGNYVVFKINVKAQSSAQVYVENLNFTYTNQ